MNLFGFSLQTAHALMLLNEMINRQMHAHAHGRLRIPMRENMNIIIKYEISNGNEQHRETINVLDFIMSINIYIRWLAHTL